MPGPAHNLVTTRMQQSNLEILERWAELIGRGDVAEDLWAADLEIVNRRALRALEPLA